MSSECNTKDGLRERLQHLLKSVPASVNSGSVQRVREFKKFHASATKAVASQRSTTQQLQSFINQASTFYA